MDFTLNKYEKILKTLKKNYKVYTVQNFLKIKPNTGVVLRHDIDRRSDNALKIAKLEKKYGILSTYYFRYPKTFDTKIIDEIYNLGHEIGYHYEVIGKVNGDINKSLNLFKDELKRFEKWNIKTIVMHGSPLKKLSNLKLWDEHNFKDFGLIGDGFISFNNIDCKYFTDTGRSWNNLRFNIRDQLKNKMPRIKNSDSLIKFINNKNFNLLYISIHPERWTNNFLLWNYNFFWQNIKNIGKMILKK
jgi:hypothetical protein